MSFYILIVIVFSIGILLGFLFSPIVYMIDSVYGEISIDETNETFNLKLNSEKILNTKSKRVILTITHDDSHE